MKAKIYHNPRCSKSRATLALLRERGVEIEIVDYLATPPSKAHAARAHAQARRTGARDGSHRTSRSSGRMRSAHSTDDEVVDLLAAEPRLLQRPIVELGDAARIGRPPERVLELFE